MFIVYFITFYCPKCRNRVSETVNLPDPQFDMTRAFNIVAERNVRGSGAKVIGKCSYPGTGHEISSLTLTGIKRVFPKAPELSESNED